MTQKSGRFKIIWKLLAFRLLVGGIITIYSPYSILLSHPASAPLLLNVFTITGLLLIVAGCAIYLRCVWDFAFIGQADDPKILIARGTYRFVRNPMYVGLVLILLGESLMFRSVWLLGYALGVWICIHLLVILYEERALLKKFGAGYEQYCRKVPRWIPNFYISIFLLILLNYQTAKAKDGQISDRSFPDTVIIRSGIADDKISMEWKNALVTRMTKTSIDSVSALHKILTTAEKDWIKLIESKTTLWNSFKDSLESVFSDCHVPGTVYVLLGFTGLDDAFTYEYNTVCFDLTALQTNYGSAMLPENNERIDRLYTHEFTHLVHKEWARKNKLLLRSFKDSVLWECIYEGLGMYRSLSKKWLPQNGVLPELTMKTLDELYPVFVDMLAKIEGFANITEEEKKQVTANLSRGPVTKKWGAFTVAIWLALEANGSDKKLIYWTEKGPGSIILLAKKYLAGENKKKFEDIFKNKSRN